ncbi:hypothetical protein TNCV_281621 [Trichonephila clavipes]|nr:hypothetical protein TNCV_281621 [Trichonephila clavipes]
MVPLRHAGKNSRRTAKCYREVGGKGREVGYPRPPPGCSTKIGIEPSQNAMSPIWCSQLRLTPSVHLALCFDEFRGPRSDSVRQVPLTTTTKVRLIPNIKAFEFAKVDYFEYANSSW